MYPVAGGFHGAGFVKLCNDLIRAAAVTGGFYLTRNGCCTRKKSTCSYKFSCLRGRAYLGKLKARQDETYRLSSYINDKKNSRGPAGRTQPRSSNTARSIDKCLCPFCFFVSFRDEAFYIVNGLGNIEHKSHSQIHSEDINLPTRLMPPPQGTNYNEL